MQFLAKWSGSAAVTAPALFASGCIIPDRFLDIQAELVNPGGVRIVEAIPVSEEADDACNQAVLELGACPVPPPQLSYGFIAGNFCRCPERDANALRQFDIYVEDPDVDEEGNPTDAIFGAFLLDLPAVTNDPSSSLAYANLFPPTEEPVRTPLGFGSYADSIERPDPILQNWVVGEGSGVDLCNDNAGNKLDLGMHSLRLMVTDRPWYRPFDLVDGEVVIENGEAKRVGEDMAVIGVPDLPGGASYATADFVFRCGDGESAMTTDTCNCETVEP